jgi:hypothetical protein
MLIDKQRMVANPELPSEPPRVVVTKRRDLRLVARMLGWAVASPVLAVATWKFGNIGRGIEGYSTVTGRSLIPDQLTLVRWLCWALAVFFGLMSPLALFAALRVLLFGADEAACVACGERLIFASGAPEAVCEKCSTRHARATSE